MHDRVSLHKCIACMCVAMCVNMCICNVCLGCAAKCCVMCGIVDMMRHCVVTTSGTLISAAMRCVTLRGIVMHDAMMCGNVWLCYAANMCACDDGCVRASVLQCVPGLRCEMMPNVWHCAYDAKLCVYI